MATDSKKRAERITLERLRSLLPTFPTGELVAGEEPDFTLALNDGKRLGIELTELHREYPAGHSAPQAQQVLKYRAVRRAQEIYDATGGPYLHVSVHYANIEVSKSAVGTLAKLIADVVTTIIPPPGKSRTAEPDFGNENNFPDELHVVTALHIPDATRSFFHTPGATWMATLQEDDLKRVLASKEGKCDRYRAKVDEVWLVVSCNTDFMSTWFEHADRFAGVIFQTKFDRVFVLSHFENRVVELGTNAKPTQPVALGPNITPPI